LYESSRARKSAPKRIQLKLSTFLIKAKTKDKKKQTTSKTSTRQMLQVHINFVSSVRPQTHQVQINERKQKGQTVPTEHANKYGKSGRSKAQNDKQVAN
jgi:hypothetical protein